MSDAPTERLSLLAAKGITKRFGGVQALTTSQATGPTQRKRCGRRLSK